MSSVTAAFLLRLWTTMVCLTTVSLPLWFTAQIKEDSLCPEISWKHLIFQHHALLFSIYSHWYKQKHKDLIDRIEKDCILKKWTREFYFSPSIFSRKWGLRAETLVFCLRIWCWMLWDLRQDLASFSSVQNAVITTTRIYFGIEKNMFNSQRSKDEQGSASSNTMKRNLEIW